jgi:hypothetical protein
MLPYTRACIGPDISVLAASALILISQYFWVVSISRMDDYR